MTSKLTIEQAKRLRNDFECWQQDYDPKDDKEQYDMFGRGMVAMDMLIAGMYQEPVAYTDERNLGYIDRRRETAYLWGKQNSEASDVALYRHAQPAPVVDADDNFYSWFGREWHENYQHNQYTTAAKQMLGVMAESAWKAGHRAAMLQAEPVMTANKLGNSPVIPDGYVMVPKEMTDEIGEAIAMQANCCGGIELDIYDAMIAAAPHDTPALNSLQSVDSVTGGWIPVSERMPDENAEQQVLACFKGGDISTLYYFEGRWDDAYGIVPIRQDVTHWMPLPAGPKEVK